MPTVPDDTQATVDEALNAALQRINKKKRKSEGAAEGTDKKKPRSSFLQASDVSETEIRKHTEAPENTESSIQGSDVSETEIPEDTDKPENSE